ncbi:MAG: hypothetical protein V4550_16495 [Gemmatimonadota bacterium]
MSAPQQTDKSAGFTGLILGAIALFVLLFGIVRMTNAHYAGEAKESPAAEAHK